MSKLQEREVVKVWSQRLLDKTRLVTEEGEPISVIYPGRTNDDRGPDFRDAVIATSRGLAKGDIEVHVKSSRWREHQHDRNVLYNGVILHVVMWHNAKAATRLQNGREVPVLALCNYVDIAGGQGSGLIGSASMPCSGVAEQHPAAMMAEFLDRAGEERFLAKAGRFQAELRRTEAAQCLYQGVMEGLGYRKNKLSFGELARRLPLQVLEPVIEGPISDDECRARLQALLLASAGLLPLKSQDSRRGDQCPGKLERMWVASHLVEPMCRNAWDLFKVRPNNSPIRRLAAMSHLLVRCRRTGLMAGLTGLVREAPVEAGGRHLEEGLVVSADGERDGPPAGGTGTGTGSSALLGSGRAADIAVNVLLPFTLAWAQLTGQPELEKKASALYGHYPRLAVNSVERHMLVQFALKGRLVNCARRQQGLLQIYNTLCSQGGCRKCPLSHLETGYGIQT